MQTQKSILADKPDIVVSTPSKVLAHLKAKNMRLKDDLALLVVDEADLVFSFGYEDEIKELLRWVLYIMVGPPDRYLLLLAV